MRMAPGWYEDRVDNRFERFYDGERWTVSTRPKPQPMMYGYPPPREVPAYLRLHLVSRLVWAPFWAVAAILVYLPTSVTMAGYSISCGDAFRASSLNTATAQSYVTDYLTKQGYTSDEIAQSGALDAEANAVAECKSNGHSHLTIGGIIALVGLGLAFGAWQWERERLKALK